MQVVVADGKRIIGCEPLVDLSQEPVVVVGVQQAEVLGSDPQTSLSCADCSDVIQDNSRVLVGLRTPLSFIVEKVKCLVFLDGTAQCGAILVLLKTWILRIQWIGLVECLVHAKEVSGTVVVVRSRLRDNVDE